MTLMNESNNNKMKKVFLFAAAIALTLASCGNKANQKASDAVNKEKEKANKAVNDAANKALKGLGL